MTCTVNISLLYNTPGEDSGPDDLDTQEQANSIRLALEMLGHQTNDLHADTNLPQFMRTLEKHRGSMIFNLTDPPAGDGRYISFFPLLLEKSGFSYTGCSSDALYMTSNKPLSKKIMTMNGISTPDWVEPGKKSDDFETGRYIIKSIWEHGSIGLNTDSVVTVDSHDELMQHLNNGQSDFFAERFLPGREINIGLLSDEKGSWTVLPPSEIIYNDKSNPSPFLDYSSKWDENSAAYNDSSRSLEFSENDKPLLEDLFRTALNCADLFELKGYARVDFRLDTDGTPYVLEVNANPCLSPNGGFAAASEKAGFDFTEVIRRIIAIQ